MADRAVRSLGTSELLGTISFLPPPSLFISSQFLFSLGSLVEITQLTPVAGAKLRHLGRGMSHGRVCVCARLRESISFT